ncbi:E3 SUMO-protein ligase SIZ1 isoform X2 [Quercus lobata]|uniref:E3 SUMO-protein ligase SIZ1 isoform X2 n=1 Tax=Quercus lobata TaxID=97700 RepID=UPI00124432AE|nr:E3 SUMO-protein ligase SIZ1 isoform X2 [Quercus lobata]XP_030962498.1 E3 SUMO-protein ligase SIZ1 isoform X2 [Quercus lobata]XP_030962504.1 E3 SUMO-protein ligase SIZ1 isoform X2 [Quercus lobata]XP_030962507.1 E3 SUMO-protein ligase SIZ1 isoform X2 [Quercus lobata]
MDLVASCKDKLAYFRIKELKDVLTQLGLSKQGKKQDLVDRILAILSDEQGHSKMWPKRNAVDKERVAKLVDDTYRKMQVSGATDLASKAPGVSDSSNVKVKGEIDEHFQPETKVRCLCGNSLDIESIIKCEDSRCNVWQHIGCVIIPEKPMEGSPPVPDKFYCEICRLSRADPFWVTMAHPLYPVKLITTSIPTDGTNPVQGMEKTFQLTRADKDLLSKQEYDVQAWCMLLNDKVPFRMQWPQYADLQVNGMPVRTINRPGSQLLGASGRDDGPIITPYTKDGINKICLTGCDARIFCVGVRIVKRRSVQQILNLIPKESDGERLEDALSRVCRCIGGGTATDNADSDSDIEVVADYFGVNLRCPMSGSRMKVAGRFKPCVHMGCFDLEVFVELNQRSRKWQCPICLKNYALENIIIDPYFNRVASLMRGCGEDATEIEVKPDGSWRVKTKNETERRDLGDLARWHSPDGTLCVSDMEVISKMEGMKQIKREGISEGHTGLKLGIRKNCNGLWEVSKPEDVNTSSDNRLQERFGNHEQKVIPMSSSATGSEDPSVNQDPEVNFDISNNNVIEMDSMSLNVDSAFGFGRNSPAKVIVLSDSEGEDDILASSETIYKKNRTDAGGMTFPGISETYPEDPLGTGGCMSLFNANDDEFGMPPLWPLQPGTHAGPGFQLFSSEDVPDSLVNLHHGSMNCSTSMNGYTLTPETAMGPSNLVPDSSVGRADTDINDGLVDNPFAFAADDPSLQIFLPTRPSAASVETDMRDQADVSNGVRTEDWISLRLGGGASGSNGESAAPNGLNSRQQIPPGDGALDSLADTASLLLGMNDVKSDKSSRQRSEDSPFSFPRQKRSKPRFYLSIDSDSE